MMLAAGMVCLFVERRSAKFGRPDHESAVEHSAPLEVGEQPGDRLIDGFGQPLMTPHVAVRIPVVDRADINQLDEAHAALRNPSRHQALMIGIGTRFERQAELVPLDRLKTLAVTVIGVGAIGRQLALQLAALGVAKLQLIDFDRVEAINVTTQGYLESDIGQTKVAATGCALHQIDPVLELDLLEDRYRPQLSVGEAIFCCVDSITARAAIWRSAGPRCHFWSDGRMLGEVIRVLTVAGEQGRDFYPTTLFSELDGHSGSCTARGAIYTAAIAAGLMLHQFCRYLRQQPIDRELSLNLLSSELIAA